MNHFKYILELGKHYEQRIANLFKDFEPKRNKLIEMVHKLENDNTRDKKRSYIPVIPKYVLTTRTEKTNKIDLRYECLLEFYKPENKILSLIKNYMFIIGSHDKIILGIVLKAETEF